MKLWKIPLYLTTVIPVYIYVACMVLINKEYAHDVFISYHSWFDD